MTTVSRPALVEEFFKLGAFFRRNLLTAVSYRMAFVADWFNLVLQLLIFSLVGRLVDPTRIPEIGGRSISYIEFVTVGIALMSFVQIALSRVLSAIRQEQLIGTLDFLLTTPIAPTTLQIGLVIYDLFYVPLRTAVFLALATLFFDISLDGSGFLPVLAILLAFIPFVWGLGMISSAATLTFRRGTGVMGLIIGAFTVLSAAYIPLEALPSWARGFASVNPFTLALTSARDSLLGGAGWEPVPRAVSVFLPLAAISITVGVLSFRLAMRRERRLGTLGGY
ncbi:MAG: ABC transporter permease [Acidimicrobiia bacterium]